MRHVDTGCRARCSHNGQAAAPRENPSAQTQSIAMLSIAHNKFHVNKKTHEKSLTLSLYRQIPSISSASGRTPATGAILPCKRCMRESYTGIPGTSHRHHGLFAVNLHPAIPQRKAACIPPLYISGAKPAPPVRQPGMKPLYTQQLTTNSDSWHGRC